MTPTVRDWKVTEGDESVKIEATVDYRHDDKNSVGVEYTYIVTRSGHLKIAYELHARTVTRKQEEE